MEEQKRLFIAIILSIVVIVGWNVLFVDTENINKQQAELTTNTGQPVDKEKQGSAVADFTPEQGNLSNQTQSTASTEVENFRSISVSSPFYNITISEKNAIITSFTLNKYKESVEEDSPLKQMIPKQVQSNMFSFDLEGKSIPGLDQAVFKAQTELTQQNISSGEKQITFSWTSPHGIIVEKVFTFSASTYLVGLDFYIKNGSSMPLNDSLEVSIPFYVDKESSGLSQFGANGPLSFINGELNEVDPDDIEDKDTFNGVVDWVGIVDRYFMSMIVPTNPSEAVLKLSYKEPWVKTRYIKCFTI